MIDLYTWFSPNGRKVSIMLEECSLAYRPITVDLAKGEQKSPRFTALNPNQRVPAIIDHNAEGGPLRLAESGAILIYLAEKTGRLLAPSGRSRARTLQWLMFQMSHVGPTIGNAHYFSSSAEEKVPYAINRFMTESLHVLGVLSSALADREYLADDYSIADIATLPWVDAAWAPLHALFPDDARRLAPLAGWRERLLQRPAVARGLAIPRPDGETAAPD